MNELEMMRRVKTIVERLGRGRVENLPFCSASAEWQINKFHAKNAEKKQVPEKLSQHFNERDTVEHGHYSIQTIDGQTCVVSGNFRVMGREHESGSYGYPYEITVIMKNGMAERIILHGGREEPIFCMVQSDEAHLYMLKESEILYIESNHNNLIWHCRDMEVKARGTLKETEKLLPEYFFRLQRGYIVNTNHIRSIEQRELVIDNGDVLLIPVRNYIEVKKQIKRLYVKRSIHSQNRKEETSCVFLPVKDNSKPP